MTSGRDSRVFQDMTTLDILDAVFGAWQGRGKLQPAWRFDVAERTVYPKRSLTTQYQESDLAFAERLMIEEGLFYFYEHAADPASPSLGSHVMVIADHNGAFQPNIQRRVRYTQPGAVMKEDSMDRWRSKLSMHTNAVELRSWDYRTLDSQSVSAAGEQPPGAALVSSDALGQYAYSGRAQGQRMADNQVQALEAQREVFVGAGTVRTLAPGTSFVLDGQAAADLADSDAERTFAITRTVHLMHNNLSAELQADVAKRIGQGTLAGLVEQEQGASLHALGSKMGERPLYRNRIDAISASVPYRASRTDGHGRLLHPRPTVKGQQSAIVVGPASAVVHTDRDHRVKVQFHWQRGAQSHSRLDHPDAGSHTGAPADDTAGTWVRVAAPLAAIAGANWGANALPRVGQEVLIDFLEGNIDRPVIIGALFNGRGQADAQHNQAGQGAGAATGNAPPWFPGESAGHAHPAVLSGLKSQAMSTSQGGSGAYSQLLFDDSPGRSRLALQRHASAHQGTAELNMGHLIHQADNQRLQGAGFGAELKTEHGAALRAAKGMLVSADKRLAAAGAQMDSREAHAQIGASLDLQRTLAGAAVKHQARLPDEADKLPAVEQMALSGEVAASELDVVGGPLSGGDGSAAAYSAPQMQLSAPSGIAATTPANAIFASKATSSITAGQDIGMLSQGGWFNAVKGGISLFTYGKASAKDKPNQETGIRLHAASGKASTQSQAGETRLTADKAITVASVTKSVSITASKHVLLTAQGASIKLEGGNIDIFGPGAIDFKASKKELAGPKSAALVLPALPKSQALIDASDKSVFSQQLNAAYFIEHFSQFAGLPYQVWKKDAAIQLGAGQLDAAGLSTRIFTEQAEELSVIVGDSSWEVITPDEAIAASGNEDEHDE